MEHDPRLSDAVYREMYHIVGTPSAVSFRRKLIDKMSRSLCEVDKTIVLMISGSRGEGFDLRDSDWDYMQWPADYHLLCDANQAQNYNRNRCTLILMESSEDRPGFVMLRLHNRKKDADLQTPMQDQDLFLACDRHNGRPFHISSSSYRDIKSRRPIFGIHGPCARLKLLGIELDVGHCFRSPYWPAAADQFIKRCRARGWPTPNILQDIISSGFHVMPIGQKGSPEEDCEWRMSFSLAELKLVRDLNHTQFMCYALLKVFLKEALDVTDENGQSLLCSYFMKTVLFWVVQDNSSFVWSPPNLLAAFWMCFKHLKACVQRGELPNFFIPENNMFRTKIRGGSKERLCGRMYELYDKGIACLQECPSVLHLFTQELSHSGHVVNITDSPRDLMSETEIKLGVELSISYFLNIIKDDPSNNLKLGVDVAIVSLRNMFTNFSHHVKSAVDCTLDSLQSIFTEHIYHRVNELFSSGPLHFQPPTRRTPQEQVTMCRILDMTTVQDINTAIKLATVLDMVVSNVTRPLGIKLYAFALTVSDRNRLKVLKQCQTMLKVCSCVGWLSDAVYLALFYCISGENQKAIPVLEMLRGNIKKPNIVYFAKLDKVNANILPNNLKTVAMTIFVHKDMTLKELEAEKREASTEMLHIPPAVMTLMLLIVCNHGNLQKQQEVLHELYFLVHFGDGLSVYKHLGDISWQILGICQQICGDHMGALSSYLHSLDQEPFHQIQKATHRRISNARRHISETRVV